MAQNEIWIFWQENFSTENEKRSRLVSWDIKLWDGMALLSLPNLQREQCTMSMAVLLNGTVQLVNTHTFPFIVHCMIV